MSQSQEAHLWRIAVSCSCFASVFPSFPPFQGSSTPLPPSRKAALNLNLISHPEHGIDPLFSPIEAVLRRHRAKKSSRSQTSKPGRRVGRRSLEIGMETGEDTQGPSGDLGIRFGCASFNQDSTYVSRQRRSYLCDVVQLTRPVIERCALP